MSDSRKELVAGLLELVDQATDRSSLARSIAAYLVSERRTKEMGSLLRTLEQARYDKDGILEVYATSKSPLSAEAKEQIKQLFSASNVQIHQEQDDQLLGGVKLRALDKAADFSVQTKLQHLRRGI